MPTTLPVPSKGALRALRSLALGTSCTIAISAGLLTEDRRRRIHAAREVHDNAKKLKSSRKYHSTGTAVIETFEDPLLQYRENAFWLPSNVLKSTIPRATTDKRTIDGYEVQDRSPAPPPTPTPLRISRYPYAISARRSSFLPFVKTETSLNRPGNTPPDPPETPKHKLHNRQGKLATDVTKLLQYPENVDEAASRFFEAFEEGLSIDGLGISQRLLEVAIELRNACEAQLKFESSDKVFDSILGSGTLHEEHFHLFHPEAVVSRLIARQASDDSFLDPEKLRKASSIFLTKFKEKPRTMSKRMLLLGEKLCAETCRFGMYDLTLDIYSRVQSTRESGPPVAVAHLIIATHRRGHHKKVFRYFHKYYTQTTPDQLEFFNVGGLAIESILSTGRIDRAEQALIAASQMAEKTGISASTTWFLKVLGCDWRTYRDLERTRSLFGRLEPLLHVVQHPQACYGAMIQFCIEASNEPLAQRFYDTMRQSYSAIPEDTRIYGHFAFAKAKHNDWLGVKDDFCKMKKASTGPQYDQKLGSSFAPILDLYVRTHPIGDIEEFVRYFIDEIGINLTTTLTNIMVEAYGKVKEIDSLTRWIDYASAAGCPVDSVTFNTILNKCAYAWNIPFWEIFRLHHTVRHLGPGHSKFLDEDTVPILRGIAMSGSPSQEELTRRLRTLKTLDRKSPDILDSKAVLRAMSVTFAKKNPIATLKVYKRAQKDQVLLESKHLYLAVKASLQLHPNNAEETLRHVQDAQKMGVDVSQAISTIIVHQMTAMYEEGGKESRQIPELAQRTVTTLEKCGMKVSPSIVMQAANILGKQGRHRLSIDVLESLSHRINFQTSSFNLATLTILLKAYIGLRDHVGIQWVIKTLSANKLYPDTRFRLYLKNARRETIDLLRSGRYSNYTSRFLGALVEALETTRLLREEGKEEHKNVRLKTIKIIENAIADQAAREELGSSQYLESFEKGIEDFVEQPSKSSAMAVEPWLVEEPKEGCGEMELPLPPPILIGVGAG
jgi:hypothetical protein